MLATTRRIPFTGWGLVRKTEESPLLEAFCGILVGAGGYRLAWVGYAEHDDAKTVRPVARAGVNKGFLESAGIT